MEAPEKLFIAIIHPLSNGHTEMIALEHGDGVEYIRKDAFIEKACKYWYQYNRDIVKKHGAKAVLGCSEFTVNVEDFKKYMKE